MTTTMCKRSLTTTFLHYLLAVGVCSGAFVPAVQAQDVFAIGGLSPRCFNQAAVAMTPYNLSIQQNQYRVTEERVYHSTGATGSFLLFGPVHAFEKVGQSARFSVTYKDPDGAGTAAQVTAQLRHVGPAGIRVIAILNSNLTAQVTENTQAMGALVGWSQLIDTVGYYVVRISVTRATTSVAPAALQYSVCGVNLF